MAGILDLIGQSTGDPAKDASINHGLLQAGLSLLGARGRLGPALSQAGLLGMQGVQQHQQQAHQQQMQKAQLDALARKKVLEDREDRIAALPGQFFRAPSATGEDATGGMDTSLASPGNQGGPGGFDYQGYTGTLAQFDPVRALGIKGALAKDTTPTISKPGDIARGPDGRVLWENPEAPEKEPEALRALAVIYGKGSPQYQRAAQNYAEKMTSHAPAVSVSYGAPVAGQDAQGNQVFFQPGKDGRAPVIVPGVTPPAKDARDKDLTESQAKATTFLGQMRAASAELQKVGGDHSALSTQAEVALAGGPANVVIGQKAQRIRQSRDQWSEAFLRFKTGAAATEAEVKRNNEGFFPKIGDKKEQVEQKARMRQQAEADMEIAAGRGAAQLNRRASDGWTIEVVKP